MADQSDQTADLSEFIDNGKETQLEPQELPVMPHIVAVRSRTSPRVSFDASDAASTNNNAPSLLRTKSQSQMKSGEDSLFKTIPQLIELEHVIDDVDRLGAAAVIQACDIDVTKLLLALSAVRRVETRLVEETRAVTKSTGDLKQQQGQIAALDADARRRAEQLDQQSLDLDDRARDIGTLSERLKSEEKRIEELREELQRKELEIKARDEQLRESESDLERRAKEVEESESRAQEQRESVREQNEELSFKVRQYDQTHKMFELQQEHFKVQSQQLNERETVLAQRHEFIHQQEDALKRRESAAIERERELEENGRALKEREHVLEKRRTALEAREQHVIDRDTEHVTTTSSSPDSAVDGAVVRDLEGKLSAVEEEFYRASDELHRSEEMNDILQNRQVALENELDFLKQEIESKNEQFAKLGHQLKEIRRSTGYTEDTSTSGTSGTKPPSSKEQIRRLAEELENARVANQAHQTQNSFLSQTLQRLLQEKTTESKAKKKTFEYYQRELDQLRVEAQQLRRRLLLHEVSGVKEEYLSEVEDMKREFFFTLTVGIKLNRTLQGQPCNLDAHALWDRAKLIHYRKWNDWLNAQFIDDATATNTAAESNANNKTVGKQGANNSTAKDGNAVSMTTFNRASQRNS